MASAESSHFDLFTCAVCLDNMLTRNPRLLKCHHRFCSECLNQLIIDGSIQCPKCRKGTVVTNNDVNELQADFTLQQMKDYLDEINLKKTVLCQLCLTESATLKCLECLQLLCGECKHQHHKIETFQNHKIYKLCKKHLEGAITHVCVKCVQQVCAKCVIKEHSKCGLAVKTYDEGIEQLTNNMTKCKDDIKGRIQDVKRFQEELETKLKTVDSAMREVEDIKQYHLEQIEKAEQKLEILNQSKIEGERIKEIYNIKLKEMEKVGQLIPKGTKEMKNDMFGNLIKIQNEVAKISLEVKPIFYNVPDVEIEDLKADKELNRTIKKKKDVYLREAILLKEIACPGNENWSQTWNISSADDGSVLICDWTKPYITCAFSSDTPTITIPAEHGKVRDACVYQGYLFTAYENCISTRAYNNGQTGKEVVLQPKISYIRSMVVNESCVYLLSKSAQKVVEFDLNNGTTKVVVGGLEEPSNINLIHHEGNVKYCVSCYKTHSVKVYDENWHLLFTLGEEGKEDGQLHNPWGVTYSTQGILVADQTNKRVSHFSFEGKFIKHILTCTHDLGSPLGITFQRPYLWMTQANLCAIKCFKICE